MVRNWRQRRCISPALETRRAGSCNAAHAQCRPAVRLGFEDGNRRLAGATRADGAGGRGMDRRPPGRSVRAGRSAGGSTLDEAISLDPVGTVGAHVARRFGPRLPFLLKVLAADAPLSLQAHQSSRQAVAGFARENAAGVPLESPVRDYKWTFAVFV